MSQPSERSGQSRTAQISRHYCFIGPGGQVMRVIRSTNVRTMMLSCDTGMPLFTTREEVLSWPRVTVPEARRVCEGRGVTFIEDEDLPRMDGKWRNTGAYRRPR